MEEYAQIKRSTGTTAIKLNEGDSIANVEFMNDEPVLVITKQGMSIHFETKLVNPIGRASAGVKSIKLNENDEVLVGLPIHSNEDIIAIVSSKGYGKKTSVKEFTVQGRGGKGLMIYRPSTIYGEIAGAAVVSDDDTILLTGQPNSICIAASDLPLLTRTSFGNIMIKSNISSIVKF
jgi:DNA gyrase subunit A